jgi:nicotinamidase-related amidase
MPKPLGDPRTTAVVFVECQEGVLGAEPALPALSADIGDLVGTLVKLANSARDAGVLTVHATLEGVPGEPLTTPAPLYRALVEPTRAWEPGYLATRVIPELQDPRDVLIPRRRGLIPTHGTDLLPILRERGVRTIVFAGVSTNIALPVSTAEATEEGFAVIIPRDAVAGTPKEYSELVIANTLAMLATISDTAELAAHWNA